MSKFDRHVRNCRDCVGFILCPIAHRLYVEDVEDADVLSRQSKPRKPRDVQ